MKRFLLFTMMFGLIFFAKAAYLENVPMTLTQPDGTKLECFASGDEFYNYLHDAQGFTIIQDPTTGFYVYADLKDGDLVPTDLIAGRSNPAEKLKPNLSISPEKKMERRRAWEVPEDQQIPDVRNSNTNHGTLNNIVIFIRFADDTEFTNSFASVNNMFNENDEIVSMQSYFKEASYNQINIPTTFYPAPNGDLIISYQDSYVRNYFEIYNATTNPNGYQNDSQRTEREHNLLKRAVDYVNDNNMIPADLNVDYDNDGKVDNVCFVVRGGCGAWSELLWPHKWQLHTVNVKINNKRVWVYNFQLADSGESYFGTSTMCHEMNHSLGAPDLYHYNYSGPTPVGYWDLMEKNATPPQHMGAYMKYRYGNWIDEIPEITEDGVYTLHDISSSTNNCYKMASSVSGQYYVFEYRKKSVESAIPGTGLLIYRINTDADGEGNADYNGSTIFDEVYIYRPGGATTEEGNINNACFSAESGRTSFDALTIPYPFLIDGTVDNDIHISNISAAGETISFTVGVFCDAPTNLTAELFNKRVSLQWDAVDDIETYSLYRNNVLLDGEVAGTSFVDILDSYGNYSYYVKSNCPDGGNSLASNVVEISCIYQGPVVNDLDGNANGNQVTLSWTEPDKREKEICYGVADDGGGVGTGSTNTKMYWAQRYPVNYLGDYLGMEIKSVIIYINKASAYGCGIYQGSATTPANNVVSFSVNVNTTGWVEIQLQAPVPIDCTKDLWIVFNNIGAERPAQACYFEDRDYASLYSYDGTKWTLYQSNISWTILMTAADKDFTYNVFKDGVEFAENHSGSSYSYTESNNGFHEYHLTTNYGGGETQPSNSVTIAAGADNEFTGDGETMTWSDPGNWSGGEPDENSNVLINNDVIIDEDVTVNSMYINENTNVTVAEGVTLTISGDAQNLSGTDGLVLESGANLMTNAAGLEATVKRDIEAAVSKDGWTGKWHFLSSPVESQSVEGFIEAASGNGVSIPNGHGQVGNVTIEQGGYDFYLYHEPSMMWANVKANPDGGATENLFFTENEGHDFVPGRGYLASFDNNGTMPFKGTVNQGETTINLTAEGARLTGFNLIGNPYPCSIDWDAADGWTRDVLGDAPFIWMYNNEVEQYGAYQLGNVGHGTNGVTNVIASCQGFFVKAIESGSISLDDNVKTTATSVFRKEKNNKTISIKVEGRNGSDEVMICYTDERFNNAEKLHSRNEAVPSLYLKVDNENYSIVNVAENESITIPMGFECGTTGKFTISSNSNVELIDKLTGNVTDLSSSSYEFIGSNADNYDRFLIRISNNPENENFAYQNGDELIISGNGNVQVIDCLGRVVINETVNNGRINVSGLNTGVYVVRMNNRNQKIVVR